MLNEIDPEKFDIQRFAEKLARAGSEAVKWEQRKLLWILEEEREKEEVQIRQEPAA